MSQLDDEIRSRAYVILFRPKRLNLSSYVGHTPRNSINNTKWNQVKYQDVMISSPRIHQMRVMLNIKYNLQKQFLLRLLYALSNSYRDDDSRIKLKRVD